MQSVSAEMFTGDQGRKLVDETLQQLDASSVTGLNTSQQSMLRDLLQSARKFYTEANTTTNATAQDAPRGFTLPCTR